MIQVDGTAVGFVNVSTDINTDILKENFELKIFNYFLRKVEKIREGTKVFNFISYIFLISFSN